MPTAVAAPRRPPRRRALGALCAALLTLAPAAPAATAAASTAGEPPLSVPADRLAAALDCPPGLGGSSRDAVLLVHGTGVDADLNWGWNYAPALRDLGYDVCTVDLPGRSLTDIQESAEYVVHALTTMRAATGRKVDAIGHSQGGLQLRWALTYWPSLRDSVDDAVSLGTPEYGAAAGGPACILSCAPALHQMSRGSAFLKALNSGDPTPGAVSYTAVYTRDDLVVTPYRTSIREGARNIKVQDVCGVRLVTHIGLVYDSVTFRLVRDALDHPGPADPARLPAGACLGAPYLPGVGAADIAYAAAVVAPAAATAALTAPRVRDEPPLRPYTS
ncbi:esterase/lipase family protein [Streptomyces qinzhouensis]|uniref:Alpha/beta fold hydrolase n=1 Tax=Streptomyces qinzhouensis TaxID=2599401 RepID=A0A5B8INF1_9ACTN|nr:alpha/beta fold hydrolase [Streptomyces qinzhouensis]QDY80198.1 alpha/beta fold hydrolase [Streptomyces qinzhouensis]